MSDPKTEEYGDGAFRNNRPGMDRMAMVREQTAIKRDIIDGNYHIHWLEHFLAEGGMEV